MHVSWTLITAFLVALLGGEDLPGRFPAWPGAVGWGVAIAAGAGFFVTVLLHEVAHLAVARRAGAAPASVTLLLFGGVSPADRGAHTARWEAAIALAGPLASVGIGMLALIAAGTIGAPADSGIGAQAVAQALAIVGFLSTFIGLVNLAPVFPLDGSRLLRAVAWQLTGEERRGTRAAGLAGRLLGIGMMGAGVLLAFSGDAVDGIFVALLGWFVRGTSGAQVRHEILDDLVAGASVGDAMDRDLPAVPPQVTLDVFGAVLSGPEAAPLVRVMSGDRLVGLIGLPELRRVGRAAWRTTQAAVAMTPADMLPPVAPGDGLQGAAALLQRARVGGLPVMEEGRLVGVLTRHGIGRIIRERAVPPRSQP